MRRVVHRHADRRTVAAQGRAHKLQLIEQSSNAAPSVPGMT